MINYIKQEEDLIRELFDLEEIIKFQSKHRVEVILGSDYQYSCYIDGKSYSSALTSLGGLVSGIAVYKKYK